MPRKARIDAPGALHHVVVRGVERRRIFRSNTDRHNFINRLETLIPETTAQCFAWALMPNHVHLLLRTGLTPISTLMGRLLTGYAIWFNKRYRRHGPLFQNRYRSILCQENPYFKELVRHIHLNPLRAGLAADMTALDTYPWCGHGVLMNRTAQSWQATDAVLALFSNCLSESRKHYRAFVEEGVAEGRRPDLTGGGLLRSVGGWRALKDFRRTGIRIKGDERILGDSEFVEDTLAAAREFFEERYALEKKGYDFQWVVSRVAAVLSLDEGQVTALAKSPQTVTARRLLCFWAHRKLGMTTVEIAKELGLCQSAVSRLSAGGEKLAKENAFKLTEKA